MRPLLTLAFALMLTPKALAGMVTVHFDGEVTEIVEGDVSDLPPLNIGDPFSGSFTYDDSVGWSYSGISFQFQPLHISMSVAVGGTLFELNGGWSTWHSTPPHIYLDSGSESREPSYGVTVTGVTYASPGYTGVISITAPVEVPDSEILADVPFPEFPAGGGRFTFRAPVHRTVSEEYIFPGIIPGGIPFYNQDGVQVATRFPAVIETGSSFEGRLTGWSIPEPRRPLLIALGLLCLAMGASYLRSGRTRSDRL